MYLPFFVKTLKIYFHGVKWKKITERCYSMKKILLIISIILLLSTALYLLPINNLFSHSINESNIVGSYTLTSEKDKTGIVNFRGDGSIEYIPQNDYVHIYGKYNFFADGKLHIELIEAWGWNEDRFAPNGYVLEKYKYIDDLVFHLSGYTYEKDFDVIKKNGKIYFTDIFNKDIYVLRNK